MEVGLDLLARAEPLIERLRGGRVGLLAHAASVDRSLRHAVDVLDDLGARPAVLFAPEHGFAATAQDMATVTDESDAHIGARIVSLYGEDPADLVPKAEHLEGIDLLVIDLADVGARYYTFVWTALLAARAAAAASVHVVVLDRPNPIGGARATLEGQTQQEGFLSFVGLEPVPIRHGLTLGEMVLLHAERDGLDLGPDGAISVVPVQGWERESSAHAWDRPFVLPSPNMPTADTAWVYPGGCLLEGTNLSDGRGLTRPFEITGAPWLDGRALARDLAGLDLPGFRARPVQFIPTFHKHGGERCEGVQIHPVDPVRFRPVATYVALIGLAQRQRPDRFQFRTERYEFVDDIPAFDLLTGSAVARRALLEGQDVAGVAREVSRPDPGWADRMADAARAVTRAEWGP
ncbi:MAG: DUF1343 domain-containing protein [Deltaproteobacteria bacterium]|jgi:uncharacterized protein YbbC (DUF1343 family)|nr:DUF1343 domain-containing protein [Deltaproteobacteria bacterium]MBW2537350.1 DUF1343 domain-containing protein [Deltaproteobacteria bacterium]